jgi:hypothetical protein
MKVFHKIVVFGDVFYLNPQAFGKKPFYFGSKLLLDGSWCIFQDASSPAFL